LQRLRIYADGTGQSQWEGMTPEALNQFGDQVTGPVRVDIVEAPAPPRRVPPEQPELVVVLCGIHEYLAAGEVRRLFPGDVVILDDAPGHNHTFEAIGKERAISLRFPLGA
jgi:hypothetical protein